MITGNKPFVYYIAIIIIIVSIIFLGGIIIDNNNVSTITQEDKVEFLIGVSQAELKEAWCITMTEEIKEEVKQHPNIRVIYTDAGGNENKQIDDINKLIDFGIDLLIVSPTNPEKLTPVVSRVYQSMPVIVLDRGVQGYDYTLYIGPDNASVGKQAGKYIVETLGEKGGNIVEIKGASNSHPTRERSEGFRNIVNDKKNIRILEEINAGWNRDRAEDKMYDLYGTYPTIDVIFAHNDAMALGAYMAYKNSNYPYPVKFIGIDGLPGENGGINLVEKGIFESTYTCPTGGKEAVQYAIDILNKQTGIPKKVILRSTKITKENVKDYKAEIDKYVQVKDVKEEIVLGFCNVGKEGGWREANTTSIKNAAQEAGIDLIYAEADLNQEKQIEIIRGFIEMKVDVISFSPVVETGWEEVLMEAKEAGIPVILADRMIKTENDLLYTTFLGSDFREEGRRAARWVIHNMDIRKPINIVEIQGTLGSTPAVERIIGFQEIISEYENIKIIRSQSGGYTFEGGKKVMELFLGIEMNTGTPIDLVYAHNDDMALGGIEAIEEFGLTPGADIKVVSIDAIKTAIMSIREGKLNCSVECNPLLGPKLMKVVKDIVSGKKPPMMIITEETVFTQEEFDREWLNRPY